jgi:SAM-dependent methyltransferase
VIAGASTALEQEQAHYDAIYTSGDPYEPLPVHIVHPQEITLWNKYVGPIENRRVLECGSGDGIPAVWLASHGAFVQAVELSPIGVERTLERAQAHNVADRVQGFSGDCTHLEEFIAPNSIDVALGFCVLHHFPPTAFGRSLQTVLKPGGRAIFLENSNANPLYRMLRRIHNNESVCGSPLTQAQVLELVAQVGAGFPVFPRFGLFGHAKKYILRESQLFAMIVDSTDHLIDAIPGSRRWSSHMWVVLSKPFVSP